MEDAWHIAKKVIAKSAAAKFVLTPEAYHVWYGYFSGDDPELISAVDSHLASGKETTEEINLDLYKRFCLDSREKKELREVSRQSSAIMSFLADELLNFKNYNDEYSIKLCEYARDIKDAASINEAHETLKSLLNETRTMAESNRELNQRLEKASKQADQLRRQLKEQEEDLFVDGLTGLYNRKAFDRKIEECVEEFRKKGRFFSLLFLDIDHFKKFNDTYGHDVGDLVLKTMGQILQQGLKGLDFPARYGGEEFVILLPETELANARIVAEQLRIKISVRRLKDESTGRDFGKVTASLGVAGVRKDDDAETLVKRADKALYLAKNSGRNNVRTECDLHQDSPDQSPAAVSSRTGSSPA